ncbi:phosphate transporter [Plakobranchus ocellatus]|uniref:Phosphate transporter n=1 Tax=Plakobranchus ocellatus TaxID=259542 RepID=A0AAV4D322_9GAST|nr:phosphate transporter [Plakobranchus ocellatus]
MVSIPDDWLWIVILGFIVSFLLAFGIGANDVANSFGTSVGAKVLTLFKACILGTIFEILGAVLIGYKVSDTIRKGIVDVNTYNNSEKLLLMGNLSALTGSCIWLFIATLLKLPVSATHSIVGATVGFSLVAKGAQGVGWFKLGLIFVSWFISPVLSGLISVALFLFVRKVVLSKENPLKNGLRLLPLFYAVTILINAISIFLDGSELLQFDKIPLYGTFIISIGLAIIAAVVVRVFIVPWMRNKIEEKLLQSKDVEDEKETPKDDHKFVKYSNGNVDLEVSRENDTKKELYNGDVAKSAGAPVKENTTMIADSSTALLASQDVPVTADKLITIETQYGTKSTVDSSNSTSDSEGETRATIKDDPVTVILFSFLQILTAVFGSFAHGGNDVSNAIGPLVGLWVVSTERSVSQTAPTPIWILLYGGVGISIGLCVLGRRVIQTMGEDLSKITPSSGFCIELGAAFTVLVASNIGIPVSTTHCKVGSIVFVGRVRSRDNVDFSLFRNIIFAWLGTLPVAGCLSALTMFLLKEYAM